MGKKFGKRWWRSVRSSLRSKDELGETEIVPWREGEIRRRQCGGVTMTRTRSPRVVERQGWRKGFRVYISYFVSRFHVYRFHAVSFWSSIYIYSLQCIAILFSNSAIEHSESQSTKISNSRTCRSQMHTVTRLST